MYFYLVNFTRTMECLGRLILLRNVQPDLPRDCTKAILGFPFRKKNRNCELYPTPKDEDTVFKKPQLDTYIYKMLLYKLYCGW